MKYLLSFFLTITFLHATSSVESKTQKTSQPPKATKDWTSKMKQLSETLSSMLPQLAENNLSKEKLNLLKKNAKTLSELAHDIKIDPKKKMAPDSDPSLSFISDLFETDIKRAYRDLEQGHVEYSKSVLTSAVTYCIFCHSRHSDTYDYPRLSLSISTKGLSRVEKARLLAATRQLDAAFDEFKEVAKDSQYAKSHPLDWERAIKQSLSLAIRVKQDNDLALKILQEVQILAATVYLKQYLVQWKSSIEELKKESKQTTSSTEEDLLKQAKLWISKAENTQKFPADQAGYIYYLKASSCLHEQLKMAPDGKLSGEALLLLGSVYEIIRDPFLHPIHEMYFESCIRNFPNSSLSAQCYKRYEQSIYFGYSGSGGTSIPDNIYKKLTQLKELAKPKQEGDLHDLF